MGGLRWVGHSSGETQMSNRGETQMGWSILLTEDPTKSDTSGKGNQNMRRALAIFPDCLDLCTNSNFARKRGEAKETT